MKKMRKIYNKFFQRIIMLPGPGPGYVLCMVRERHVILKAALHSRLAVQLQLAT